MRILTPWGLGFSGYPGTLLRAQHNAADRELWLNRCLLTNQDKHETIILLNTNLKRSRNIQELQMKSHTILSQFYLICHCTVVIFLIFQTFGHSYYFQFFVLGTIKSVLFILCLSLDIVNFKRNKILSEPTEMKLIWKHKYF